MKYRYLFWGILLIAIGLLFILNNLGIISFSWSALWSLWPLILVFWGISILPLKGTIKVIILLVVILGTLLLLNRLPEHRPWFLNLHHHYGNGYNYWNDEQDDETTGSNSNDQNFTVPIDSLATKGILNLDAAAGNFRVEGETNDFLDFSKKGEIGNYELTTSEIKGGKNISIKLEEGRVHGSFKKNKVDIKLNPKPSWNLVLDIGAAELDLDLSNYKIDTATIESGASSMDIKIGSLNPQTVLTFNAGASSINVKVPKNSGCQISSDSFLVSKNFEDFDRKGDHIYETSNFAAAQNKIFITVKTAVSSINVKRY
jgi:hypothetical protein